MACNVPYVLNKILRIHDLFLIFHRGLSDRMTIVMLNLYIQKYYKDSYWQIHLAPVSVYAFLDN